MIKWNVAAYVRLSSDDEDKVESDSITNQKSLIEYFLENNKDLKLKDFYIDDGFTGTDFDRPSFQRLLNDIKFGKINAVIVKDLSRFGRNYIEVGNYLEQVFPLYNVRFIAINDNIDSFKDPKSLNNVVVPFKNLMNDEYARDISNKVRSILDTKKVNGEFIGSIAPYGYLRDTKDKHKLIIDEVSSKVVKKIFKMILDGKSKTEVIDELNKLDILPPRLYQIKDKNYKFDVRTTMQKWDRKKLDNILKNRVYTGELVQSKKRTISYKVHKLVNINVDEWVSVKNSHRPIINKEDFERVQNIIYNRDTRIKENKKYDVFSGHLKCADCQNTLTLKKGKRSEYYYCTSYLRAKECTKHSISKSKLEEIVVSIINTKIELILDIDNAINYITKNSEINYDYEILKNRLSEINTKVTKYEKLIESVYDDYNCKIITRDEYLDYKNEYFMTLKNLKEELSNTQNNIDNLDCNVTENKDWMQYFMKNRKIENLTKKIVDELIDYICLDENGNIKIIFRYEDNFFEAINFINQYKYDIIKCV